MDGKERKALERKTDRKDRRLSLLGISVLKTEKRCKGDRNEKK